MKTFTKGTRVRRLETGETGTVRLQFIDGYVSLTFDDGSPAELDSSSLVEIPPQKSNGAKTVKQS